jgi:hypothetical protein
VDGTVWLTTPPEAKKIGWIRKDDRCTEPTRKYEGLRPPTRQLPSATRGHYATRAFIRRLRKVVQTKRLRISQRADKVIWTTLEGGR